MTVAALTFGTALLGLITTLMSTRAKQLSHDDTTVQRIVDEHRAAQAAAEPVMVDMPKRSRWRTR